MKFLTKRIFSPTSTRQPIPIYPLTREDLVDTKQRGSKYITLPQKMEQLFLLEDTHNGGFSENRKIDNLFLEVPCDFFLIRTVGVHTTVVRTAGTVVVVSTIDGSSVVVSPPVVPVVVP